jgi:transcriptional regulator with AAA-type ATPase domain
MKSGDDLFGAPLPGVIGQGPAMREVYSMIRRVALADSPVLLVGETGTGKELFARAIHQNSARNDGPFIQVNCATLSDSLPESELFGHVKGAFRGARANKVGLFEAAHMGTIFLDEISGLGPSLQLKFQRVLQDLEGHEFQRLGERRTIRVNVRVVAATNRSPEDEVSSGRLREDLYHRLNVLQIRLPPLREHREDIVPLARFLLERRSERHRRDPPELTGEVLKILTAYDWPGNVRELENAIEYALVRSNFGSLEPSNLPPQVRGLVPALPRRPVSSRASELDELAFSSHTVITSYPAPIAAAYRRFCDYENPTDRVLKLFAAAEAVARYLVILGVSDLFHCLAASDPPGALPPGKEFAFLQSGARMQMGMWIGVLRTTAAALPGHPGRVLSELPALGDSKGLVQAVLDELVKQRNRCIHDGTISISVSECEDLIPLLRPKLDELLQLVRVVRHYPLGFVRRGLGRPRQPGTYRYYFHSCMGARIPETEHAPCEDVPVRLLEEVPFVVAPGDTRLLYLWPLLLERQARLTGRRTLYLFEDIPDDAWPYLTRIRSTAIDVKETWRQELAREPSTSHSWLLERLRQMRPATPLPAGLDLGEKLQPARRGQLAGHELRPGLRLLAALAAGGFGTIYVAELRDEKGALRPVAVKVLEVQDVKHELPRFEREFDKLCAAGGHVGIVRCYERGISRVDKREYPWYSMELAVGDLTSRLDARRGQDTDPLPWDDPGLRPAVVREFRAIVEAVAHLHTLEIVHRDLKPGNVLVLESGELRLSDFGLVKNLKPSQRTLLAWGRSSTGGVKGTIDYMAPEQFLGRKVGKPADVYALGVILAELATGQRPRKPATYPKQGSPFLRSPRVKRLPEALRALLADCTNVEPSRRPPDAQAVQGRFTRLIEPGPGAGVQSPPTASEPTLPES